ncbi:hypothetical protein ACIRSS_23935 [Amycolatopsis sp. NPDC101161]|uniref:hypothetical protein n=1 Tax=Amycolatopsis sp. NPDC101161 TaxID=3363940 RepID=UPI0037F69078
MTEWLVASTVIIILALIMLAGLVAVMHHNGKRAERAYRVLRILLWFLAGSLIAAIIKLHEAGLL